MAMEKGNYLDSWKEISAYLGRNVRTCRNWERDLGLPVHRLDGSPKSHVFAYTGEIDAWREKKGRLPDNGALDGTSPPPTVTLRRSVRAWIIAGLAAGPLLASVVTVLILSRFKPAPERPVGRFTIKVEPGFRLDGMCRALERDWPSRKAMAVSADGRFLVYSAIAENPDASAGPRLYLRPMDSRDARPIAGSEGGINPFLSPDNRWVGFWADGRIMKVPVEGGVPVPLCEAPLIFGASWGADNTIVFADYQETGLSRISGEGGIVESLTLADPKRGTASHRLPSWLPDAKALVFTVMRHAWDSEPALALLRLDTREWSILLPDAADAKYVPTGHLVFMRRGTLMAVRFDAGVMRIIGQPFPVVGDVMQAFATWGPNNTAASQFDVSGSGSLVYASGGILPDLRNSLVWVDESGTERSAAPLVFPLQAPRLSPPDGRRIVYVTIGREWNVFVYDLIKGTNSQVTHGGWTGRAIWTPDAKGIIFAWQESSFVNLFLQSYEGTSPAQRLTTGEFNQELGSLTPDGRTLAFIEERPRTQLDIMVLDMETGIVRPFLDSPFVENYPEISPDGRWIAYASDETGRPEVYVRPFPGPGAKHQVSNQGGGQPLWNKDMGRLFYRWNDQVWAADVRIADGFSTGKPRLLFDRPGYAPGSPSRSWDLSPDGRGFLMVKLERREPAPVTEMVIVENWFQELERMAPVQKSHRERRPAPGGSKH
jgi:hypothetical protein